jgi:hypothetical protein
MIANLLTLATFTGAAVLALCLAAPLVAWLERRDR